jgi:hypothetical protein
MVTGEFARPVTPLGVQQVGHHHGSSVRQATGTQPMSSQLKKFRRKPIIITTMVVTATAGHRFGMVKKL